MKQPRWIVAVGLTAVVLLAAACGGVRTTTTTKTRVVTVHDTVTHTVAAPTTVYVPQQDGPPQYKPSSISFSADSGNIWGITRWISYGGDTARALATTESVDCNPTCASGHRTEATTTILFSAPIPCKGVPAYSGFMVVHSSNQQVAADGDELDLSLFCK